MGKPMFGIYLPSHLASQIRDDATARGQSLATWFERAATLALSPAGRMSLAQLDPMERARVAIETTSKAQVGQSKRRIRA